MRPIDDILADVIEAIEPLETLPGHNRLIPSPLGLWLRGERLTRFHGVGVAHVPEWRPDLDVDGLDLIDAARVRGCSVAVYAEAGAPVAEAGVKIPSNPLALGGQKRPSSRAAVILALADALGVEVTDAEQ